jgi:hypothetical protein
MVVAYFYFKKWCGVFYLGYQQMGKEQHQKWCMGCFIWDTNKFKITRKMAYECFLLQD